MSDYIRKSALIESIKAEIQCVEKEKQQYFDQGNFHNGNILVEKIQAMKLVLKIVANEPTLDETEIIRKHFERVVEQLNGLMPIRFNGFGKTLITIEDVIKILKEECGISE